MIIILSFLLIIYTGLFAQIEIDGGTNENLWNCDVIGEDGSILKYSEINLLDGNLKTATAINIKNGSSDKKAPFYYLIFKNEFPVDKIVINNGFEFNTNIYYQNSRPKEVQIQIQNNDDQFNHYTFQSNIQLLDSQARQEINLGNEIKIRNICILVSDTYPGTKYDDICISEMEFWNKGEKYKVANLEEAKKEYVNLYKTKSFIGLNNGFVLLGLNENGFNKIKQITGWDLNNSETNVCFAYFEKNGIIDFRVARDRNGNSEKLPHKGVITEIGNWKFDEEGRFFIKLKGGKWNVSKSGASGTSAGGFLGTDLECKEFGYAGPRDKMIGPDKSK